MGYMMTSTRQFAIAEPCGPEMVATRARFGMPGPPGFAPLDPVPLLACVMNSPSWRSTGSHQATSLTSMKHPSAPFTKAPSASMGCLKCSMEAARPCQLEEVPESTLVVVLVGVQERAWQNN
jgi:hypothetical protein